MFVKANLFCYIFLMKIWVALSGGVDSSVAASLLKEQEAGDITCVFMKNWDESFPEDQGMCTWKKDREDAMRVATRLGLPFRMIDFSKEYREKIVDYFFREYANGRTPNPDALCNREIKFGILLERAQVEGVDYIVTGHYARVMREKGSVSVYTGVDQNKDQSYFLSRMTRDQFEHALFPIGDMTKQDVRLYASKHNLPTAEKKDSQGLCFIGHINIKEFLSKRIIPHKGNIINEEGVVLGVHDGAEFFTIGQREGIGLSGGPYFVIEKNIENNTIIVAHENSPRLFTTSWTCEDINFLAEKDEIDSSELFVRTRYREPLKRCDVFFESEKRIVCIVSHEPVRAITPGQIAVVYNNEGKMLFSAIINTHVID